MRIHNYGNDYAQAWKFKGVDNAGNRVRRDGGRTTEKVRAEDTKNIEAKEEGTKIKKAKKQKEADNSDNI